LLLLADERGLQSPDNNATHFARPILVPKCPANVAGIEAEQTDSIMTRKKINL